MFVDRGASSGAICFPGFADGRRIAAEVVMLASTAPKGTAGADPGPASTGTKADAFRNPSAAA